MKLRWKKFESRLKLQVKSYDARFRMTFWQRAGHFLSSSLNVPLWALRSVASLIFAGIAIANADAIRTHPDLAAAAASLWGLAVAVTRAGMLWNTAQLDPDYRMLWMLPVLPVRIFQHMLRRVFGGSVWLFLEFFLVFAIQASSAPSPGAALIGAGLFALLQSIVVASIVFLLVACRLDTETVLLLVLFISVLLVMVPSRSHAGLLLAEGLCFANPVEWGNRAYLDGCLSAKPGISWWLLPVLAISGTLPFCVRSVRQMHLAGVFQQPLKCRKGLLRTVEAREPGPLEAGREQKRSIWNDHFARPLAWGQLGPIERIIGHFLNQRERLCAEALIVSEPHWSKRFVGLTAYFILLLAANRQISFESLDDLGMALTQPGNRARGAFWLIACVVLWAMMLARLVSLIFGLAWPEWTLQTAPNVVRPYRTFRLFPVTYWDTAKVTAKISLVAVLALAPLAVACSLAPVCQMIFSRLPHSSLIVPKCLVLLWGCSLLIFASKLSPSIQEGLRYWKVVLQKLLVLGLSFVVGITMLVSRSFALDILLALIFLSWIVGWLVYSGVQYRKGIW